MNTPEDHALRYREEPEERRWELELALERADVALVPIVDTRPSTPDLEVVSVERVA